MLTATAMSAATGPDPLPKQRAIVGHIDTPERSNKPINADAARTSSGEQASLGTMICCHRRRAGGDINLWNTRQVYLEELWEARRLREAGTLTAVSRWERLVRKARKVRRLQRYWGHIGQTLQTYGSTFRTHLQDNGQRPKLEGRAAREGRQAGAVGERLVWDSKLSKAALAGDG